MSDEQTVIELPKAWALSNLTVHFEGDLRDEAHPFAANVVAYRRLDVEPNSAFGPVVEHDLEVAEAAADAFEVIERDVREDGADVECVSTAGGHKLRHLTVYRNIGGAIYTLIGTHQDDRFEKVRSDIVAIASRVLGAL